MTESAEAASRAFSEQTAWARSLETPLRGFLRTEIGSAAFLLAATLVALAWVNIDSGSYERVWRTQLSIHVGGSSVALDLRHWVNNGLMTLFFFVIGLEARREFDMGELRQRRRIALPVLAGPRRDGGAGRDLPGGECRSFVGARLGRRDVDGHRVRARDAGARRAALPRPAARVHAHGRRRRRRAGARRHRDGVQRAHRADGSAVAVGIVGAILVVRQAGVRIGLVYAALGAAAWVALFKSGVDPVVIGLVMGLLTYAYPAARGDLERATDLFRLFREQPTPELERTRAPGFASAISANERLQQLYHPWTSYVIVPLFALANAGIAINGGFLRTRTPRRSHSGSSSVTSSASRSGSPARPGS